MHGLGAYSGQTYTQTHRQTEFYNIRFQALKDPVEIRVKAKYHEALVGFV